MKNSRNNRAELNAALQLRLHALIIKHEVSELPIVYKHVLGCVSRGCNAKIAFYGINARKIEDFTVSSPILDYF